jgi:alkanesulfonate monooxygenase SsuD/methylene tetrahydromethanopterin reductase-like flavin-dependent oxidoreductase (luciferase family)
MDFGILLSDRPTSVPPAEHFDGVLRAVEAAQKAGMNHIMLGQHFLFPGTRWLQPVPLLARLAGEVGPEVRLVTQIMIAPLYHPVLLAEELATLDIVTEGRLKIGLGLGYLNKEFEIFGVALDERAARFEETIAILKALWTNDRVTFEGRFWTLDDVPVHIRPVQEPHPEIWIGAESLSGVRRAARLGDKWPITPQLTAETLRERLTTYLDKRAELGKPLGKQPCRREIMLGADRDDALNKAVAVAEPLYLHMAKVGNTQIDPEELKSKIRDVVAGHYVLGTAADCAEQLRELGAQFPVDPIVTRANWLTMSTEESVAYIESLGEELIPTLRDFESVSELAAPVG